jgi:CxxC-x17-CxxC domain-containing protein
MDYQDRTLKCVECGNEFLFTAGEQIFYRDMGLTHDPKRCRPCKVQKKSNFNSAPAGQRTIRTETEVTCANCGTRTLVPFKPTQGRPVLCGPCLQAKRSASA